LNTNLYLDIFIEEAKEHINSMNEKMLLLEKNPDHEEIVQELFRSAHTIKGMAATMGFEEMTTLTHELEGVLDNVRNQQTRVNGQLIDSMLHCIDLMEHMLISIAVGGDGKMDISRAILDLKQGENAGKIEKGEKGDWLESSESSSSLAFKHLTSRTIRVDLDRMDMLMNLFTELIIDRGRLDELSKELNDTSLTDTVEHISRITGDMQNIILNMRMIPIEHVFSRFPRMVRDLARELKKRIRLEIHGSDTEMDRTCLLYTSPSPRDRQKSRMPSSA
jgi:chemotaxis protein histidine kinase CheA